MNKYIIAVLLAVAAFYSCKKDDTSLFNKSADERLTEALKAYQTQLSGAQNGWKATLYPKGGGVFSFYFKFNDSNRVQMLSDFDSSSAANFGESSYRIKGLQQPSLLFDTYSYLHVLSDPDETVNGGTRGAGLVSDFEFYFDSSSTDTIKLVGRFNGSKAVLVRATQQEATAFANRQLANGLNINKILTYFKRLTIGNQLFDVQINLQNRSFTFSWLGANGVVQSFTTNYYLTIEGITFANPLVVGNTTISSFNNMNFNATTASISMTVNNQPASVAGVVVPLKVDVNAPARWWNQAAATGDYWISATGFHSNGVDNAFNITALKSGTFPYYYLIYWPAYTASNDVFAPIFLNTAANSLTLSYGTAPRKPTFTSDGRAVFVQAGTYGAYPSTGAAASSRTLLYNSSGYYFVQTSPTTYDMVSASDGKSWITWEM
ncbi:MAG: hypothetical protein JWQ40_934 [Segetibacter sp.]|nr:hypothetical protein [Segetibacter sp.]